MNPSFVVSNNGSSTPSFWIGGVNQNGYIGIGTTSPNQALTVVGNIYNTGIIGIGTTTTDRALSVHGNALFSGTVMVANLIATGTLTLSGTGTTTYSGALGVASSTPWGTLSVEMEVNNPSFIVSNAGSSSPSLWVGGVNQNGYIGIGTSTPNEVLTVAGNIANLAATSTMKLRGSATLGNTPTSIKVAGRYAYVIDRGTSDLRIFDVSSTTPAFAGSIGLDLTPQDIYISGRYAYVVDGASDGLKIIDISNPAALSIMSSTSLATIGDGSSNPLGIYISGRYAYVVDSGDGYLKIIDVSDPVRPSIVSMLTAGSGPTSVFVSGRYAYVAGQQNSSSIIIDISDPFNPKNMGSITRTSQGINLDIKISGNYAYVNDNPNLRIIDVSDPANSQSIATISLGVSPTLSNLQVSGRYVYVFNSGDGKKELIAIDVSIPDSPVIVSRLNIAVGGTSPYLYVSGRYAYVANGTNFSVIDISGIETTSAIIHSLEAGNLQVRSDVLVGNQLTVTGGLTVGQGGILSTGPLAVSATTSKSVILGGLIIGTSTPATTSPNSLAFYQSVFLVEATSSASIPFTIRGAGTQLGNYLQIQSSTNTSQLVLSSSGRLGIGTSTPATELAISSSATTTIYLDSSVTTKGSCIQLKSATSSAVYHLYIGANDVASTTSDGRSGLIPIFEFGACK